MASVEPEGGDPACWLDDVCPACGRFVERPNDHDPNCELKRRISDATTHSSRSTRPVSPPAS